MGMGTEIQWCDATFNPWIGCTKVSDGCKFCYAETLMDHRYGKVKWGPQGTRQRTSTTYWRQPLQWNKQAQTEGKRYRVFCASLADVFENRPELQEWRLDLFRLIEQTKHLDWLLLTKRPQHVFDFVPGQWLGGLPDNVWIGTSVENQEQADKRIPALLSIPAKVRFLSMEPLLGPVDLGKCYENEVLQFNGGINWIIVGGESGQNARPMHPAWARALRDQCQATGVPFLFKQWGEWGPVAPNCVDVRNAVDFGNGDIVQWLGKKNAGRLLDAVEYSQFPT